MPERLLERLLALRDLGERHPGVVEVWVHLENAPVLGLRLCELALVLERDAQEVAHARRSLVDLEVPAELHLGASEVAVDVERAQSGVVGKVPLAVLHEELLANDPRVARDQSSDDHREDRAPHPRRRTPPPAVARTRQDVARGLRFAHAPAVPNAVVKRA